VLRFEVSEVGQEALPAVDIGDAAVVIGSAASARIRLPRMPRARRTCGSPRCDGPRSPTFA